MPVIKTNNGNIHYKTVPLYRGVKVIDKEKALDNLVLLKSILDKQGISFQLAYGTLLGAVRDGDFISHDEDIDLIILYEEKEKTLDSLHLLVDSGFEIARYDRRGLLSIIRNGEYIDLYFFERIENDLRACSGALCPAVFYENTTKFLFKGDYYNVPADYTNFFRFEYGEDWQTPIQWANYEQPFFQRLKMDIKMKVRDALPDFLYFRLVKIAEKKMEKRYMPKVLKYWEEHNIHKND